MFAGLMISSFNPNFRPAGPSSRKRLPEDKPHLRRLSLQPKLSSQKDGAHKRSQSAPTWAPKGNEWKRDLAQVKREYLDRKYRHCASHCRTLLEGAKNSRNFEVTHLIYLHFYAASALEMQLRNLHHSSSYRRELLAQARDHYRRASILSESEHEVVGRLLVALSSPTRSREDSQSPLSSVSSQGSQSTRSNSPTLTAASDEDEVVGLSGPKSPAAEPSVRPDSPTLGGFGDCSARSSPEPFTAEDKFAAHGHMGTFLHTPRQTTFPPAPLPQPDPLKAVESQLDEEQLIEQQLDRAVALRLRSLNTFSSALLALQHQIGGHLASLEAHDAAASGEKALPPPPPASNHELRALDLQARISRLRAAGWKRPRFDVQRYEALRESALADLME